MIHQLGFVTHFIQVMSSNEKTVGKGGRKKDSSDKTRVNTFIFSLEPERQYFCSCWNVSCLRQDFSCRIFCEKRNNKDIGLALGTSNPQVEVPMCFCLLLRFKVREMQDSFFQFLSLLFCIENKWTNKKKKSLDLRNHLSHKTIYAFSRSPSSSCWNCSTKSLP